MDELLNPPSASAREGRAISIIKTGLSFGRLLGRRSTRRIIIHHSASSDVAAATIHSWHLKRGWSGIGYHFVIRQNGDIEEGRPLDMIGAHAGSLGNGDSIGICLTGNFMEVKPSEQQLHSLVELVQYLRELYQDNLEIMRHKDVVASECPGDFFPWPEDNWRLNKPSCNVREAYNSMELWKNELVNEALRKNLISERHDPDEAASKWFVLALGLNILKEIDRKLSKILNPINS